MNTQPKTLQDTLDEIQKRFGAGAVQLLSAYQPPVRQPTGLPALDDLLGGGLLPGVMTALQGQATSGRVTLALRILAQMQARMMIYLDVCGTFDAESAVRCGIALDRLIIVRPEDQLVELLGALLNLRIPLIVLDESGASRSTPLPQHTIKRLVHSGTTLLVLPPSRQVPAHAGARLMVERVEWIRYHADIVGCRSRVTVIEQRGVSFGRHVTLDLMLGGE